MYPLFSHNKFNIIPVYAAGPKPELSLQQYQRKPYIIFTGVCRNAAVVALINNYVFTRKFNSFFKQYVYAHYFWLYGRALLQQSKTEFYLPWCRDSGNGYRNYESQPRDSIHYTWSFRQYYVPYGSLYSSPSKTKLKVFSKNALPATGLFVYSYTIPITN